MSNILYGHQPEKLTLPYGILAEIPEEGAEMRFVERAVGLFGKKMYKGVDEG